MNLSLAESQIETLAIDFQKWQGYQYFYDFDSVEDRKKSAALIFKKILFNQSMICTSEQVRDTLFPKFMSDEIRLKIKRNIKDEVSSSC